MGSIQPPHERKLSSEFFIDRSLGKHAVAEMLRGHGHTVHLMADMYPGGADQLIADDEWIAKISTRGWIVLTKDSNIARYHRSALAHSTLRVFALDSAQLTGDQMRKRYEQHLTGILRRSSGQGPMSTCCTRAISSFDGHHDDLPQDASEQL